MGQAIDAVPFVLPGVHEVWRLLLDIKKAGDGTPLGAYIEHMNEAKGTEYDLALGADPGAAVGGIRARDGGEVPPGSVATRLRQYAECLMP